MNPIIGFCKLGDKLKAEIAQNIKRLTKKARPKSDAMQWSSNIVFSAVRAIKLTMS